MLTAVNSESTQKGGGIKGEKKGTQRCNMHVLYNECVGECNTALYNHLKPNTKIL
jgi:hypothetical protein